MSGRREEKRIPGRSQLEHRPRPIVFPGEKKIDLSHAVFGALIVRFFFLNWRWCFWRVMRYSFGDLSEMLGEKRRKRGIGGVCSQCRESRDDGIMEGGDKSAVVILIQAPPRFHAFSADFLRGS